ncbi:MAG: 2-C-methyl-D-erythritol 2,4-cyclodiphosphate synthase, partial [Turneriella sp.]|nr:2-C-methyl-D-erythritol 2,4-cyclodiphosphate synthase [Turneriella sp.]
YTLANLDCNIICEEPRIAPLREKLRQSLATLLRVSPARISIKGRSHEGLDAIGERRAIACQGVVLLMAAAGNPS